jgi:hypothetical protein
MSNQVQLAVYDLSQGMARTLSAQFLGPAFEIPAIPHTGIIVYGTYTIALFGWSANECCCTSSTAATTRHQHY